MRTHPDIGLVIGDLLQLARFWLCTRITVKYIDINAVKFLQVDQIGIILIKLGSMGQAQRHIYLICLVQPACI